MKNCKNCKYSYIHAGMFGTSYWCSVNHEKIPNPFKSVSRKCECYEKYKEEKKRFEYPKKEINEK